MLTKGRAWLIQAERLLWTTGTLALLFCLFTASRIVLARGAGAHFVSTPATGTVTNAQDVPGSASLLALEMTPAVVGRVEIPALGMSTPLLAGDDSMSLSAGAGHIPGTAYPGGLGTVGIAGHRDTHFRLLREVEAGMDVKLTDRTGTYYYRVTSSEIVSQEQVNVLDILSEPGLVLITCYPFSYIGHAPKRFVVHAALVSAAPDQPSDR